MINTIVSILDYFFNFSPDRYFPLQWIPLALIGLSVVTAILIYWQIKVRHDAILRKILMEYPGKFITISVLLALNLLARLYRVEVISMRFFTYILILWLLFSFYQLLHDLRVTYPNRKRQIMPKFQRMEEKYRVHKNKGPRTIKTRR